MGASVVQGKGRWAVAAAGALVIVGALLLLFRLPVPAEPLRPPTTAGAKKAIVKMARPDDRSRLLREEAELRDLRPLFLPTERNAALPEPRLEPGRSFLDNETLKLKFTEADAPVSESLPKPTIAGSPAQKASVADALSPAENPISLQGFGRRDVKIQPLKERAGYIEVMALKDGKTVVGEELPVEARPPAGKPWSPVQLLATVDAAGLVETPVVVEGSRVDEVDDHFKKYLARTVAIWDRLPPGFYRITVAP